MSTSSTPPPEAASVSGQAAAAVRRPDHIYLVSYPKIVFLYPTFFAAVAAGVYMLFAKGDGDATAAHMVALIFLVLLALNLVVFSFDFPRTTSLTLFFFVVALVVGLWSLATLKPGLMPAALRFFTSLDPLANATFYFMFAGVLGLIFIGVAVSVRFDYWEVRPNELLHHHGILSDLKRYPAPQLRIDKEINDVFEYLLLRSGRLILHPSQERRAIVLDNVFFINRKEEQITRMLGALQVQVRGAGEG
ncbi:MAG: hypothetical protein WD066_13810 [Planctomycetaceae bacterium]